MKILKVLLIGLLCISLSGCKKEEQVIEEPVESVQEEAVQEDTKVLLTMDEILEIIKEHYGETKLVTTIGFDDSADQIDIEIYDPDLNKQFMTTDSDGELVRNEAKQEQWEEYVDKYVEEATEFKQLLLDNEFDSFVEVCITIYLEDIKTVDKGYWTPVIYIIDDSIIFN